MDVAALEALIAAEGAARIPLVMLTVTNNSGGGQPVSMANIEAVKRVCRAPRHSALPGRLPLRRKRLVHPRARARLRRLVAQSRSRRRCSPSPTAAPSPPRRTPSPISADFCATNDDRVAQQETNLLILTEGFPTYGGLAGRDLDAIAVGLEEILDPDYLRYRIVSTGYLGRHIADHGVPIVEPPGGHAIYIDAARMLPHIPPRQFPGQALAVELYRHAGIRSVEIGSVMFGDAARHELLRLAIPRRVYTQSHIDYVVEAILEVNARKQRDPRPGDRRGAAVPAPFQRALPAALKARGLRTRPLMRPGGRDGALLEIGIQLAGFCAQSAGLVSQRPT